MTCAWLVRAGEGGFALTDCVERGEIALRYTHVPDAARLSIDQIAEGVRKAGTRRDLRGVARMLYRFVNEVEVGDLVVSTHSEDRAAFFGTVTGGYRYTEDFPLPEFRHVRDVRWLGSLDRDRELGADHLRQIDRPPTLYELDDVDDWLALAARADDGSVRPPSRPRRPTTVARGVGTVLCRHCFQQKPVAIVHDGVCADCSP